MKLGIIIFAILLGGLILLYFIGSKSVHTEILVNSSAEKVWNALTDVSKVKEWNKVLIPVEGEIREGNKVVYEFYQDPQNISVISAKVRKREEMKLLNQYGGIPGVLTFNHKYILKTVDDQTKVIVHEEYSGIMVPFWNPSPVEKAYSRLLESLKLYVESNALKK